MAFTASPSCAPSLRGHCPLHRYYGRSDCCRRCPLRASPGDGSAQPYPMNPSTRPCSNHPTTPPDRSFDALCDLRGSRQRRTVRPSVGGSPPCMAESSSSASPALSGPPVRSRLLPTPPRGDAVTLHFSPVSHLRRVTTFTFWVHGLSFARLR